MQKNIFGKKFFIELVIVLLLISAVQSVNADWWPMYGHDSSHSRYSTFFAPNTNNTIWNFSTGGPVESSPAVYDYKVYVGSWNKKIYCLNSSTGDELWNYTTGSEVGSSPAVADGKVYVGSYDKKIYCLNAETGSKIWEFLTGGYVYSSPVVVDGKVYVGSSDNKTYCLNSTTGIELWNYSTGGAVDSSPVVVNGKVYFGSNDSKVYCLNADNGAMSWNYTTTGSIISSPAVADGKVYIGTKTWLVYCLNAVTGALIWDETTGGIVESSPAVAADKVFIGSHDHKLYCFDADTGADVWSYTTGENINWSSPAVADGKVYVGSQDKKLYCFDADTGDLIWDYVTGDSINCSSPAIADGKVYVGSWDGNVYCFGDPIPIADFTFEPSSPTTVDVVYFNSTSFDADGSVVNWTWDMDDGTILYGERVVHQYVAIGDYTVNLTVKDNDNATDSVEQVVSVVNSLPVADFTFEPNYPFKNQTIYLNSTSFDADGSIVNWTWNMDDGTILYGENVTHEYVDDGDYTVNLTIKDNDDDFGYIEQVLSVGNKPPSEPSSPNPANNATGVSISADLSWTGGDLNSGDTVAYDVYFGTTNPPSINVSNNQTATTYNLGTLSYSTKYYWKIVSWDSNNSTTSGPVWAFTTKSSGGGGGGGPGPQQNNPPVADANGPYSGIINTTITFDGSGSTDSGGTIVSYEWTFGDGSTGEGVSTTHSYRTVGNYSVKLTVTDNGGLKDSDVTYAVISDKPNSPPNKPSINGNVIGKKSTNYNYVVVSTDEDNDAIKYVIDWDDGTDTLVTDFMQSATAYTATHSWASPGLYVIKVSALDEHNSSSENSELMVLIDAIFSDNIGYLIDTNGDGIYELFHSNTTGNETEIITKNGGYLIDTDGDGKWNYSYDPESGLSVYQEEKKEEESPGFELVLLLCVVALFLLLKRRKSRI
jgi:outer membrane protein assembly factor BamB